MTRHRPALQRRACEHAAWCLPAAALLLLVAPDASAHLVRTGFGPLVDSLVHVALGPDAVMTAAAAGFLCGMRPGTPPHAGRALFLYGWVLFFLAGAYCQRPFDFPIPVAVTLLGSGALVAADLPLPTPLLLAALGWAGGIYGLVGGGAAEGLPMNILVPMAALNILVLVLVTAGARSLARRFPAARIAVRVAGSWIAAIGLLQLGWAIKFQSMP